MKDSGVLPITHPDMTRFNITLDQGVDMVLWAMQNMLGGEIFVPKIPSYRILDVAEAVCPQCEKPVVGIRPGEKLHEEMITRSDAPSTIDIGGYYAITPSTATESMEKFQHTIAESLFPRIFITLQTITTNSYQLMRSTSLSGTRVSND